MSSLNEKEKTREERTRDCCKNLGRLVDRGEMPIELGVSWLSAKAIKVARPKKKVAASKAIGNSDRRENPRTPRQEKDRQT